MKRLPYLALALVATFSVAAENKPDQPKSNSYLSDAFSQLDEQTFPEPTSEQKQAIDELVESIREAARRKDHRFTIGKRRIAKDIGSSGFPMVVSLLKSDDPWVRGMAAETIYVLDEKASAPFLIGLLADEGKFRPKRFGGGKSTVASTAECLLRWLGFDPYRGYSIRIPADEEYSKQAYRRAVQRWSAYHIRYCDYHRTYSCNELALNTSTPVDELPAAIKKHPERFERVAVVELFVSCPNSSSVFAPIEKRDALFSRRERIVVELIFTNLGKKPTWIHWDKSRRDIHVLKMVDPKGKELSIRPGTIAPLEKGVPDLQALWNEDIAELLWTDTANPLWNEDDAKSQWCIWWPEEGCERANFVLRWELELSKMYDLSEEGIYRFYYTYKPPTKRRYAEEIVLRWWDGRQYVDYFEFRVKGRKRGKRDG